MKKIVLMTAICCLLLVTGCGSKETKDIEKTQAAELVTTDEMTTDEEAFVIPSRENFAEIPDEAEQSFDYVVKIIDKNFPKKKKSVKRYYGYLGEEQIDGALSYVFAVYDSVNGTHSSVATAAVTADCSRVYALDENSGHYWLIEKNSPAQRLAEYSWTVTTAVDENPTNGEDR